LLAFVVPGQSEIYNHFIAYPESKGHWPHAYTVIIVVGDNDVNFIFAALWFQVPAFVAHPISSINLVEIMLPNRPQKFHNGRFPAVLLCTAINRISNLKSQGPKSNISAKIEAFWTIYTLTQSQRYFVKQVFTIRCSINWEYFYVAIFFVDFLDNTSIITWIIHSISFSITVPNSISDKDLIVFGILNLFFVVFVVMNR
jgi:hypothetical protein